MSFMTIYIFVLIALFVDKFLFHLMYLSLHVQVGGELMDFIIVLRGPEAVRTFCSRMHFSLGAGVSAAAGPVGRVLEADLRAGDKGSGVCYTYSCSKGNYCLTL
jgi:lipid-binding SYLF domain-containing protein